MTPEESIAKAELEALVKVPGALKIITNMHACGGGIHPSFPGFRESRCVRATFPMSDPRHFVLHDVASLEFSDHGGVSCVRAYSAMYEAPDGRKTRDWTEGRSADVLKRLQEWKLDK